MRHTSKPGGHMAAMLAAPSSDASSGHRLPPARLDAVIIRDLVHQVGRGRKKKCILNQINLTVPEGSIYGLLGPSGCGKTTMLRCMVGRFKPRSGSVLVFGLEPGAGTGAVPGRDVGYMPQEISIYEDFTIEETLQYFGRINRMPVEAIQRRIDFLLQFLDLPSKRRTVANLSGGQKRRVSLAAALVHSPPLLILDEPTVGVDPLLRQAIWQHLVAMTRTERISVIITTHYIEEARLANVVGLMRNGRILAEDSPDQLMQANGLTNLEEVFLKLCITDSSRRAAQLATSSSARSARRAGTGATAKGNANANGNAATGPPGGHSLRKRRPRDSAAGGQLKHLGTSTTIVEVNEQAAVRQLEASILMRPTVLAEPVRKPANNRTTVRINTATNQIELLEHQTHAGAHVNEAVEDFSSESDHYNDVDDDDDDDDDDEEEDDDYSETDARLNQRQQVAAINGGQLASAIQASDQATDNYLALQHMHWATRRANVANLMRIQGRQRDSGLYKGLDGRRGTKRGALGASLSAANTYEHSYGLLQWWKTLMAVTWKNYVRLRRNPPVLVFQFMLPAIQVILFCLCIGGEPFDVPVAIVNDELVPKSSLEFLNGLNKKVIRQIKYDNLSSAMAAVRRGKVWGAIHIPDKYSENLQSRLIMGEEVTNETISNGTIRVYPDLTNLHLAMTLESTFRETFINFARNSLEELGYDKSLADLPIQIGTPVYGTTRKDGYLEFMAPGVVISISYVMATGLTALAFILERRDGLLERSLVSGVQTSQILLAHAINQIFVMVIQIFLVLGCTFFIFEIPSRGPFFWVVLLILLQGCTGMAFGLLVSAICAEENTAVMMVVGTFYTNLILAGIIWPIEAMPHWLRPVSWAQPQTLPTNTLRHILSRGWDISEPGVLLGFAVTIGWLVVFLCAAGVIFKYSK